MVRIQDSQSWHRGSIPLSTTKRKFSLIAELFFLYAYLFLWIAPDGYVKFAVTSVIYCEYLTCLFTVE